MINFHCHQNNLGNLNIEKLNIKKIKIGNKIVIKNSRIFSSGIKKI